MICISLERIFSELLHTQFRYILRVVCLFLEVIDCKISEDH